jgi:hypothetical protein
MKLNEIFRTKAIPNSSVCPTCKEVIPYATPAVYLETPEWIGFICQKCSAAIDEKEIKPLLTTGNIRPGLVSNNARRITVITGSARGPNDFRGDSLHLPNGNIANLMIPGKRYTVAIVEEGQE